MRRTRSVCNATSEPLPAVEPVADERPFPRVPKDVCLEVGGLAVHLRTVDSGVWPHHRNACAHLVLSQR